ncbi:MAG: hypothetical protein IPK75_15980 [Acidobacteria bacterium]|nr:hypothetical protein [Acidobacteriota bacterium]
MMFSRLRPALSALCATLAVLAPGFAASADAPPLDSGTGPAPVFDATNLPLRPGERLLATADGDCSVIVFAPHDGRYQRFANYWQKARWIGPCRFGLAHGDGTIAGVDGDWSVETSMLYGIEINPAEITNSVVGQDGALSWTSSNGNLNFFSGTAFSDLATKRYVIRVEKEPAHELELGDLVATWYGTDYLERHTFDADGRERTMSVSAWNIDTYCGFGLPDEFKPVEKEVKKICKKNGDKHVLLRRDGLEADPWEDRPITWVKACAYNKARRTYDCGKLVKEALGKDVGELETFLTDGDAAARKVAMQEIIDRYAPLEAAFAPPALAEETAEPASVQP